MCAISLPDFMSGRVISTSPALAPYTMSPPPNVACLPRHCCCHCSPWLLYVLFSFRGHVTRAPCALQLTRVLVSFVYSFIESKQTRARSHTPITLTTTMTLLWVSIIDNGLLSSSYVVIIVVVGDGDDGGLWTKCKRVLSISPQSLPFLFQRTRRDLAQIKFWLLGSVTCNYDIPRGRGQRQQPREHKQ